MGRGVWLFTNQASRTIFRVESRIAESVVQETAIQAIRAAARAQQRLLHGLNAPDSKANLIDVSDNVQATCSVYDQRFGRKSKVITGFWGTLVLAEDYEEGAFDAAPVKDAEDRLERKQLTVPLLLQSIDTQHLGNVSVTVVTRSLIDFSPDLTAKLKDGFETSAASLLQRHQIPEDRHTKVFPLGSNSANEMTPQGMKQGLMDHISTQRGITEDNLNGRVLLHSGDGKTFDMYLKLKKLMSTHEGDFESLRCMVPLLENWHTKWTGLCRDIRAGFGKDAPDTDPSTLKAFARETNSKPPTDLKKVDYYQGRHLLKLASDAHILQCWEYVLLDCTARLALANFTLFRFREILGTNDIVGYFAKKAEEGDLPTLEDLQEKARVLVEQYTTTKAWERARNPVPGDECQVPLGSAWEPRVRPAQTSTP